MQCLPLNSWLHGKLIFSLQQIISKKLISLFIPQAVSIPSFPACFLISYFESLAAVVVYLDTAKMTEGGNVRLMRSVKGRSSGVGVGWKHDIQFLQCSFL